MYDCTELITSGVVTSEVTNPANNKTVALDFYIVPRNRQPILGAAACLLFEFLSYNKENICDIEQCAQPVIPLNRDSAMNAFHDVFNGDGTCKLQGKVHVEVDPSVTPVKLPLRKLPPEIKDKVKAELENKEAMKARKASGRIAPLNENSQWINSYPEIDGLSDTACMDDDILAHESADIIELATADLPAKTVNNIPPPSDKKESMR